MQQTVSGFVSGTYTTRSIFSDVERCINLYVETLEATAGGRKSNSVLYGTAGLGQHAVFGSDNQTIRGIFQTSSTIQGGSPRCFVVVGATGEYAYLVEVLINGGDISRGQSWRLEYRTATGSELLPIVLTDGDYAVMQDNGFDLFIAIGAYGNVLALLEQQPLTPTTRKVNSVSPINPIRPDGSGSNQTFQGATSLAFINGFIVATIPRGLGKSYDIIWSNRYDALTWSGLSVAKAESDTDAIQAVIAQKTAIFLFGTRTVEAWSDTGDVASPLQRQAGNVVTYGVVSPRAVAVANNGIYFVSSSLNGESFVFYLDGSGGVNRISTYPVEYFLSRNADLLNDAIMSVQIEAGHEFVVLNFNPKDIKSVGTTWVYDVREGVWHERQSYRRDWERVDGEDYMRHRANFRTYFNNTHIATDHTRPWLYVESINITSDDNDPIRRRRVSGHLYDKLNRLVYNAFQLDIQVGSGLTDYSENAITGADNKVSLSYSSDGGHTWSDAVEKVFTTLGIYKNRLIWYRLGMARDRVFKVDITANATICIINAYMNVTGAKT